MQRASQKIASSILITLLVISPLRIDFFYLSPDVLAEEPLVLEDWSITENTTWNKDTDLSGYSNIYVEEGVTLTIEKGSQLALRHLYVYGNIMAVGTMEEKISLSGIPPVWDESTPYDPACFVEPTGNIEFDGLGDSADDPESVLEFVEFSHMGGYYPYDTSNCPGLGMNSGIRNLLIPTVYAASAEKTLPAVTVHSGKINLKNCIFDSNAYADVQVEMEYGEDWNAQSYLHVENSNFQNNSQGTAVTSSVTKPDVYNTLFASCFDECKSGYPDDYSIYGEICGTTCTSETESNPSVHDKNKVVLTNNWYGDESGPSYFAVSDGPALIGERISGDLLLVDYWRETPDMASNVIFLPGIKASRLDNADDGGDQIWLPESDGDVANLLMDKDGKSIHNIYTKNVVENAYGIVGIYDELVEDLAAMKFKKTIKDYTLFSYDWRMDVENIAKNGTKYENEVKKVVTEIENLQKTSISQKVTVIAHSNGGLLAKAIMQELEKENKSNLIDNIVLVSSPQMGTPETIPAMLHGYDQALPYLSKFMDEANSRELTENMPGAYGLLPSEEYFQRNQESLIDFKTDIEPYKKYKEAYGEKIDDFDEFRKFLLAKDDKRTKPAKEDVLNASVLNEGLFNETNELHSRIDNWTPPEGTKLIQIAGWGLDTISGMEYSQKPHVECVKVFGLFLPQCAETSLFDPIMEPKFTSEGDGTVTAPSSLMMPAGGGVERLWLDLYKSKSFLGIGNKHKDILEMNQLREFLSTIIKTHQTPETLPEYISSQKPVDYTGMKPRIRMSLYSPLDIHLYDEEGNHTGPTDEATIEESIPNTYYKVFGEQKYVGWSTEDNIRVELAGYGEGSYTIKLQEVSLTENGEENGDFVILENLLVISGTQAEFDVPRDGLKEMTSLSADYDGDGNEDYVVVPKINSSATLETGDEKSSDDQDEAGDGIDDGQGDDGSTTETNDVPKMEKKEKAKIEYWKAYQYKTGDKKCPTRMNLALTGRRFDDNVSIRIGNRKANSIKKEGSRRIVARFCMEKLLDAKIDLKRTIYAINPDADKEKARKQINLGKVVLKIKK